MTPAASLSPAPALSRPGLGGSLALFYAGVALVHAPLLPSVLQPGMVGRFVMAGGLLLALQFAPLEYSLGALTFGFLAASWAPLQNQFQVWRWVLLGAGFLLLTLRYSLRYRSRRRPRLNPFVGAMLGFVVVSVASVALSPSVPLSAVKLMALVCLLLVAHQGGRQLLESYGPAGLRRFVTGQLAFAGGVIAVPIAGYWLSVGTVVTAKGLFSGYQRNPNAWALMLMLILPWTAAPLLERRPWSIRRYLRAAVVAILAYSLLLTGSRAGILGVAVAAAVAAAVHASRRIAAVAILLVVAFCARSLADPNFISAVGERYLVKHREFGVRAAGDDYMLSRAAPWSAARRQFETRPWMGLGFGITTERQQHWSLSAETGAGAIETGSSIWAALLQVGVLGSLCLFLAVVALLGRGLRFAWRAGDPWFTAVYTSAVALTVNSLFEGWLLAPGSYASAYYWLQCFLLNAMMDHFRPAPARPAWLASSPGDASSFSGKCASGSSA